MINACAAAVAELETTRAFAGALENENRMLRERLETEKRAAALLGELVETRRGEAAALREALSARSDELEAKDAVILAQEKLIENLRKKQRSTFARLGDVLLGVGIMAVIR